MWRRRCRAALVLALWALRATGATLWGPGLSRPQFLHTIGVGSGILLGSQGTEIGVPPSLPPVSRALEAYDGADPRTFVARGMERFKRARVAESVADFDQAIALNEAYADVLWQRGLALYYLDRFDDAAKQFKRDTKLNPSDTEESIWHLLSVCQRGEVDLETARASMLSTLRDRRPYMRLIYDVFRGSESPESLEKLVATKFVDPTTPQAFYASLYLALYAEARGKEDEARLWLAQAVESEYGPLSRDYMWYLAQVHQTLRGRTNK